jgi:hypothetical protein
MVYLVAVGVLVGCSAGSSPSTTSHSVMTSASSAATEARATVTPSATASLSQGLLGVLPVPVGAKPWPNNTNALLSRAAFVELAYTKSDWTAEEGEEARRGFVAAVQKGWDNADGSQQSIRLVRFATPAGAKSAFDEVKSGWKQQYPDSLLGDAAIGAVGWSSPTLDSRGNAVAEWGVAVGDSMILAIEYTAATPDPAAAKALLLQQYDRLKNVS